MKTAKDPRHQKRQHIVQLLFTTTFNDSRVTDKEIQPILDNLPLIDKNITEIAPDFPVDKINKVDLSILRLCVYELLVVKEAPQKVIIDEGIELAKEFGGDSSPAFINGALGKLVKEIAVENRQIEDRK